MRRNALLPMLALLGAVSMLPGSASAFHDEGERTTPVVRIGTVIDGLPARESGVIDLFRREIEVVLEGQYEVVFPESAALEGNWDLGSIRHSLDRLLADPEVDLVLALGRVSSHLAASGGELPKPVVAPFVISSEAQKLPLAEGTSGVKNLSYIEAFNTLPRDLQTLREVAHFGNLVVLVDMFLFEAIPGLQDYARTAASEQAERLSIIPVEHSAGGALTQLDEAVDAVVVTSLPRVSEGGFADLVGDLMERRLPSYSTGGRDEVEAGLLASVTPASALESLARSTALNVHDILRGVEAGSLPVFFDPGRQFTINMATARAIGVHPSLAVLTTADLLNEERTDVNRVLTLQSAVAEALEVNLGLAAFGRGVSAGAQSVREARSRLLPQIGIASDAVAIDEDRAAAAGGSAPERSWAGSIGGSQVIWSEQVRSGYDVEKSLQKAREEDFEAVRLDIIRAAAVSYLDVLRAVTQERILKNNLKLTRANLERAEVRLSVGIAGPEEVYRWESQVAEGRAQVLRAESQTLNARAALNRLLNRPPEEEFVARESGLDDQVAAVMGDLYGGLVANPGTLEVFRSFLVAEAMSLSPELRRIDAEIDAAERKVTEARRSFWLPEFYLRGGATELLAEGGEGLRGGNALGLDDTEWSVGVFADLPLFTSGGKKAALERRREELAGLAINREGEAERIAESVVTAVNLTRASYPAIGLSREAAEAAGKNLDLITDSYERGIKSIIDLLDAQNQALVSDQRAASATFDFLVDLMGVERAVGRFFFLLTEEERDEWLRRFEEHAAAEGVSHARP